MNTGWSIFTGVILGLVLIYVLIWYRNTHFGCVSCQDKDIQDVINEVNNNLDNN